MDDRPADAARRALRAARRQQPPVTAPRKPTRPERVPDRPPDETNRPGGAARDALRQAVSARSGARTENGPTEDMPPELPENPAADSTPPKHPGQAAAAGAPPGGEPRHPAGPRPADAAREALRAALARREAQAEQPRTGPATPQAASARRPAATSVSAAASGTVRPVTADTATPVSAAGPQASGPAATDTAASPSPSARRVSGQVAADAVTPASPAAGWASGPAATDTAASPSPSPSASPSPPPPAAASGAVDAVMSASAVARRAIRQAAGFPDRGGASVRGASVDARDVRELVAGVFRMPGAAAAGPGREGADDGRTPQGREEASAGSSAHGHHTSGSHPESTPSSQSPTTPATPRVPPTMASPHRDGELRRTFPAFATRAAGDSRFAETWWGNAWVTALEEGALDAARLARGRGYAETGHVDAITVTPGLVLAYVKGSRPRPYRVQVRLRTLDDADWERFLDAAAERPGHIAALLDKEMPQSLADCGVPLLPGPGDLEPHCSCPDRGHPCKHAAALCYRTARLLDADPFVLLLLRGRGERQLLDALSRLSATRAARAAQEKEPEPLPGVRASDVLARRDERRLPPPPAPLPPPPHPEQPPVYAAAPGGPDPFALDQLATDAAARAHALLTTGRDPVGGLTLWQDAVRLAAARPGSGLTAATRSLYASLASLTGRTPADLARAVAAWRQGGPEGLAVLEEPWDPPAGRFDRARPLLLAADLPAFRPWRNRLTHPRGHLQLRLGRDGLWYAYESEPDRDDWWPRGTADLDPVGALTGLGTPNDL
ncbi:SWIM zinc finger family protein [Streptomyces sp. JNUCC 63]